MAEKETSPIDVLRYDTVIRLTQYRADHESTEQSERFVSAWNAVFGDTAIPGVLYRELCRQRPEWSALAAKEIEHPIEATFIEYLVAEPETDLTQVPAMPEREAANFTTVQDLHTVAFRFKKNNRHRGSG